MSPPAAGGPRLRPARVGVIARNFLSVLFGNVASRVLGFVAVAYLTRVLGPNGYGQLSLALAAYNFALAIADLGLQTVGIRTLAQRPDEVAPIVTNIGALKAVLALGMAGLLSLFGLIAGQSAVVRQLTIGYSLALIVSGLLIDWVFTGLQRMQYIGIARIVQYLAYPLLLVFWVRTPAQIQAVPLASALAALLAAALLLAAFARLHPHFRLHLQLSAWAAWLRLAFPLALSALVVQIYLNLPVLLLGWLKGETATGYFAGAFRVTQVLQELVALFLLAFYPVVAGRWTEAPAAVGPLLERVLKLLLVVTVPMAMSAAVVGGPLLAIVLGDKFALSTLPFQIMIWNMVIVAINGVYAQLALLMNGKQKEFLIVVSVGAVFSFGGNLILIPWLSYVGVAVAWVLAEMAVAGLSYLLVRRLVRLALWPYLWRPLLAASGMALGCWLLLQLHTPLPVIIAVGAAIYGLALVLLRGLDQRDWELARGLLQRNRAPSRPSAG